MEGKQVAGAVFGTMVKIVVVAIAVMPVYRFSITAYDLGYRLFGEEPMTQGEGVTISVTVEEGDSVKDVGTKLEEKGLIRDADLFYIQEKLSSYKGRMSPGIYELNTSMMAEEMLEVMAAEEETDVEE
ncbi:MAG: endolytic transglycosylase MltG [Clostridiales bacterium]|nr:endolytic transglycosylase MltG [Clostridiales bacterium]